MISMEVICGKCKSKLRFNEQSFQGKKLLKIRCPKCQALNKVDIEKTSVLKTPTPKDGDISEISEDIHANHFHQSIDPAELKTPEDVPLKNGNPALAWLVVHTEDKNHDSFPLFEGKNTIGRENAEIPIESDKYISRFHCCIEIIPKKRRISIILMDDGSLSNGKASTNGTFHNADINRLSTYDQVYLDDGDTIQVGQTKLVLKLIKSAPLNTIINEVSKSDYLKTIIE